MALFLKAPPQASSGDRIRLKDLVAIKDDPLLARHCLLIFCIYLVHSQLIAPLSVYAVEMRGLSESGLGLLYTLNGLLVVSIQIPVTRLLSRLAADHPDGGGLFLMRPAMPPWASAPSLPISFRW